MAVLIAEVLVDVTEVREPVEADIGESCVSAASAGRSSAVGRRCEWE